MSQLLKPTKTHRPILLGIHLGEALKPSGAPQNIKEQKQHEQLEGDKNKRPGWISGNTGRKN